MLVEHEVGHEPFQSAVFVLQRSQLSELADAKMGVFFLCCTCQELNLPANQQTPTRYLNDVFGLG
jgi:hypothetical protein